MTTLAYRLTRRRTNLTMNLSRAGLDVAGLRRATALAETFVTPALAYALALEQEAADAHRYAPAYQKERKLRLLQTALDALSAAHGPLAKHGEELETWRQQALRGFEPDPDGGPGWVLRRPRSPATPIDELRAREVRDLVRSSVAAGTVKPLELRARYLQAIADDDAVFVEALEQAPRAFPLLSAADVAAGVDAKIARSPLAADIQTRTVVQHAVGEFAAAVWRDVTEGADVRQRSDGTTEIRSV